MSTKTFDITPDLSLLPKLGQSGYTSPQAIAELVDNSIDAKIESEVLEINIKIDKNAISVADNGRGMNDIQLSKALTLAYSEKENMLGEFGLGLKTACTSLGRYFEVITTPKESPKQYKIIYDQDEWTKGKRKWEINVEYSKSKNDYHFTIIKIGKLYKYWPQLAEFVKKDMERRFAPFIEKKQIKIKVNGKPCKPKPYELIEGSKKDFLIRPKETKYNDQKIYGWYGLLKEGSQKGFYGFHTYRRGRMITTYDKMAIGEHPTISRIIGEIHLDFVPVTHDKTQFRKESEAYLLAEKYLREEFKELLREARQKAGQDKITPNVKNEIDIWKEKISQAVITSPELKYYTSQIDPKTGMVKDDNGEEQEIGAEKREAKRNQSGAVTPENTNKQRLPQKINPEKKKIIKVKGQTFEFEHEFASLGKDSSWKQYSFDKKQKKIIIYTNTDFPAYLATKDTVFYAVLHIAESISEIMVKEISEEIGNAQDIKETILRIASSLKTQID